MTGLREISLSALNIKREHVSTPIQAQPGSENESKELPVLDAQENPNQPSNQHGDENNNNNNNNNNKTRYPDLFSLQHNSSLVLSEAEVTFSSVDAFLVQNDKASSSAYLLNGISYGDIHGDYLHLVQSNNGRSLLSENVSEYQKDFNGSINEEEMNNENIIGQENKYPKSEIQYDNHKSFSNIEFRDENNDYGYSNIDSKLPSEDFQLDSSTASLTHSTNHAMSSNDPKKPMNNLVYITPIGRGFSGNRVEVNSTEITDDDDDDKPIESTPYNTLRPPTKNLFPVSPLDLIVQFAEDTCETAFQEGADDFQDLVKLRQFDDIELEEEGERETETCESNLDDALLGDKRSNTTFRSGKRFFSRKYHEPEKVKIDHSSTSNDVHTSVAKKVRKRDLLKLLFPRSKYLFDKEGRLVFL